METSTEIQLESSDTPSFQHQSFSLYSVPADFVSVDFVDANEIFCSTLFIHPMQMKLLFPIAPVMKISLKKSFPPTKAKFFFHNSTVSLEAFSKVLVDVRIKHKLFDDAA